MKTKVLLLVSCSLWTATLLAQTSKDNDKSPQPSGIYLRLADFRQGKITLPIHCNDKHSRIRLNEFFGRPHITLVDQGRKQRVLKDTIFGLRDCQGHDFRVYQRQLFEIEEVKTIAIYRHVLAESGSSKGFRVVTRFFFSKGIDSAIMPLTRTALEEAFPRNEKLHDLLESWLQHNHEPISSYDSYYRMFKVNRLLKASI